MTSKPIIGLAPMDGVTDAVFRYISDKHGHPNVIYTEFVSVDGLIRGKRGILRGLFRHETKTPIIAQLFGSNENNFYDATIVALELGFDGIDINMGCPERSVYLRGGGAALINTPDLAKKIIIKVKQAIKDWSEGKTIDETSVNPDLLKEVKLLSKKQAPNLKHRILPVSVKTRTGYSNPVTKDWINSLLESFPDVITIHGRTLVQRYSGTADWEQIGLASKLAKNTNTQIFGNGDIRSKQEALEKIKKYNLAGVLIGRGALGNPWVFNGETATKEDRMNVIIEHCERFLKIFPDGDFHSLRKHLAWYVRDFEGSARLRNSLMSVNNITDVKNCLISN